MAPNIQMVELKFTLALKGESGLLSLVVYHPAPWPRAQGGAGKSLWR
jgi:hypothetical protein